MAVKFYFNNLRDKNANSSTNKKEIERLSIEY